MFYHILDTRNVLKKKVINWLDVSNIQDFLSYSDGPCCVCDLSKKQFYLHVDSSIIVWNIIKSSIQEIKYFLQKSLQF